MIRSSMIRVLAFLLCLATGRLETAARAAECEAIANAHVAHVAVSSATMVAAGGFVEPDRLAAKPRYPDLPSFCRVVGAASPVPGSHIGFEVWLPAPASWSHRLHVVGNGGYGSNLYYAQLAARLQRGDVAAATDTGHKGGSLLFGRDNREAIVDWGGRAIHETTVAAKAILLGYYGARQRYSYFSGSSTGGHEGLTSAQRYPDDFDGIIAGAPGNNRTNLNIAFLWNYLKNHRPRDNSRPILSDPKLVMLNRAVLRQCDALDGVRDGVLNDPSACHFDPASLTCPGPETPDCLTPEQVATVRAIYKGPRDARDGHQIFPGYAFGSEGEPDDESGHPGWSGYWADPQDPREPQRVDFFRYWVFNDPKWDWWSFDWGKDVDTVNRVMGPVVNATDPDLSRFRAHGGKLIMFIGWSDPVGSAYEAADYYESVIDRAAGTNRTAKLADTQRFARLYMIPGMGHTAGGPGATNMSNATRNSAPPVEDSRHDMALALYDWVEKGIAPGALIGTHYSKGSGPTGTIAFERPLCVYPLIVSYRGGPTDRAGSFTCKKQSRREEAR